MVRGPIPDIDRGEIVRAEIDRAEIVRAEASAGKAIASDKFAETDRWEIFSGFSLPPLESDTLGQGRIFILELVEAMAFPLRGLVRQSARFKSVEIYLRSISPELMCSRTRWKRRAICLVLDGAVSNFAKAIAA